MTADSLPRTRGAMAPGGAVTLWVLWMTYGSFYFCRQNISAAVPFLRSDAGLNEEQIGLILGALKLTYGLGQFVNGQLAERLSARRMLAVGMMVSALLNIAFGFHTALYYLVFIWACNGYFQALGWTPCMRVAANWYPISGRGRAIGIIGTGYQAIASVTYIVAGQSVDSLGWRAAFYVPAVLLLASSLHMLFVLRESPPETGAPSEGDVSGGQPESAPGASARPPFLRTIGVTLSNPAVWLLAITLGLLNACRYFYGDWGLTHLKDVQGDVAVAKSAAKYAVLPLGGIAGAYLAGWATDRFFGSRRAPVICLLLLVLGALTLLYRVVVHHGTLPTISVLVLIGFAIYGAQVLLVGTAPVDLAREGTPAAAVGLVNCIGYMGAFMGDQVTGTLRKRTGGWDAAVYLWAICACVAALTVAFLWKSRGREERRS